MRSVRAEGSLLGALVLAILTCGAGCADDATQGVAATTEAMRKSAPDLVVTDVTWSPASLSTGNAVIFAATIKNQGGSSTRSAVDRVTFAVDGVVVAWADDSSGGLAAGASRVVTANGGPNGSASWTAAAGSHAVRATADASNSIFEKDETNNALDASLVVASSTDAPDASSPPPPPPPPPPSGRAYGYSAHVLWQSDSANYVQLAVDGGATTVRDDFPWGAIEPQKGNFVWSEMDQLVTLTATRGLSMLAMAGYAPSWATGCTTTDKCGPIDAADYGAFVAEIARRYGHGGQFWAANPSVPYRPLDGIEIWNEPNIPGFWMNPDAARYTTMLKAAYTAIKSVDPQLRVVSAGLAPYGSYPMVGSGINPVKFLETMYANGAQGFMDAVGWHPYCFYSGATATDMVSCGAWAEMEQTSPSARSLMIANGDGAKTIWATELGVPVTGDGATTESEQGNYASLSMSKWKSFSWAGNYYWYDLRDDCTDTTNRECSFGAVRRDDSGRPSYFNLKSAWTSP